MCALYNGNIVKRDANGGVQMGKVVLSVLLILAAALSMQACRREQETVIQEPETTADPFVIHELCGSWIRYRDEAEDIFVFSGDTVRLSDGSECGYTVTGDGNERSIALEEGKVSLTFKRRGVNGVSVSFLFDGEGTAYINRKDLIYTPENYMPDPERERSTEEEEGETFDTAQLEKDFLGIVQGEWVRVSKRTFSDVLVIDGNTVTWSDMTGDHGPDEFYIRAYPFTDKACELRLPVAYGEPTYFDYREKTIDGNPVRTLFGISELDGGPDPENVICALVKKEDLDLLPEGYDVDRIRDNSYVYVAPVRETRLLFLDDVMDAAGWIGKPLDSLGADPVYFEDSQSDLDFSGFLFSHKVSGTVYAGENVDEVTMVCSGVSAEEINGEFTRLYGEPVKDMIPYVSGIGVTDISVYDAGEYMVRVDEASEVSYLIVKFSKNSEE